MKQLLFCLVCFASVLSSGWGMGRNDCADPAPFDRAQVQASLKPLTLSAPYQPTAEAEKYCAYYGLSFTNTAHYFGTLESEGSILAGHVFVPENPKGTLFLVHGFLDHTGTLSPLIAEGLNRGYAVVSWDLPGHGLSSGERTDTGPFEGCALQLADWVHRADGSLPHPYQLIAHSTGCSIAIEFLQQEEESEFDRVVFLAPLVRHEQWGWAKFGYHIADPFTSDITRKVRENSSDEAYLEFARHDPLVHDAVSFAYLDALYTWEKRSRNYEPCDDAVVIIQGEEDKVVDWKHNMERLQALFPKAEVHILPGARHQLANESEIYRPRVFELVFGVE